MVTNDGTVNDSTATHLRSAGRSLPGAASPLLLEGLLTATRNLSATLRLVLATPPIGELLANHRVEEVLFDLGAEDRVIKIDRLDLLAVHVVDVS